MGQKENPFFSIIIPVYNTGKELPRCLKSVLNQTFKDFECIMVDDGSTDGSGQVCDEWAAKDSRFISIHKPNGGASEARNVGIEKAGGRYTLFIDSDDYWNEVNSLQDIYNCLREDKYPDVLCIGVTIIDENGNLEKVRLPYTTDALKLNKKTIVRHMMETNGYFSAPYAKIIKTEILINNRLFFMKGLLSEDIEWSGRILVLAKSFGIYSSAFYYRVRRGEGSLTSSISEKNILDILYSIKEGIIFIRKNENDIELQELYYQYWAYQYAMLYCLIGNIEKISQKDLIDSDMKQLKWLLKYDSVRKVRLVHYLVNLFGVQISIKLLSRFYKIRNI